MYYVLFDKISPFCFCGQYMDWVRTMSPDELAKGWHTELMIFVMLFGVQSYSSLNDSILCFGYAWATMIIVVP